MTSGPSGRFGTSLEETLESDLRTSFTERLYAETDPSLSEAERREQAEYIAYVIMQGSEGAVIESPNEQTDKWTSVDYTKELSVSDLKVLENAQSQLDADIFGWRDLTRGPDRTPVLDQNGQSIQIRDVGVSDAYSAMTSNATVDFDGDGVLEHIGGGWSHDTGYYNRIDDNPNSTTDSFDDGFWPGGERVTTGRASSELWGNYFAAQMTQNVEGVARIDSEMPQTRKLFDEMAREM